MIAEAFLASKIAAADNPEVYQVIVHVGTDALAQGDPAVDTGSQQPAGVSAETPAAPRPVPGDPAGPARCHVDDGPAISVSTAQMIGCTAALSWMLHDHDGTVLDLGRRGAARPPRCAAPPGNGTPAGAGSRAVSPAGSTCTTFSTGATAAAPS